MQTILITGATSGIGKATASLFAEKGFQLILTGRRKERLTAIKADLKNKFNANIHCLVFDIRHFEETKNAIESLPKAFAQIDILLNNAGLASGYGPIHLGEIEDWDRMMDTNVKGLLNITRLVSPDMVSKSAGHIINVCSTAGHEVYPNGNVYCASKHAVDALTKSMRLDLHKHNIKVSQISPGHVEDTEFAKVRFHGDQNKANIYNDFVPLNATNVANIIYFMASQPSNVNIQDILVMGTQQASNNHIHRSGR